MSVRNALAKQHGDAAAFAILIGFVWLLVAQAAAGVPGKMNYQGLLADGVTHDPLPGTYAMTFRIFDVAAGGTDLWHETQEVTVDSLGVFTVMLGSDNPIDIPFTGDRWLEVTVGAEILSPRRELVSVPFAFYAANAESLNGLDATAFAASTHNHDDRYYTESELNSAGTLNNGANPVDWTKLKSVPAGFADGTDDTGPGDGYSLDAADGYPTDVVYVDNGGFVGVGTTAPERLLHLFRGSAGAVTAMDGAELVVEDEGNTRINLLNPSNKSGGICFGDNDDSSVGWMIYDHNQNDLALGTNNADRLVIDSQGRVGIGVASPSIGQLEVSSTGTAVYALSSHGVGVHATGGGATIPALTATHTGDGPCIYASSGGAYPAIEAIRTDGGTPIAGYASTGTGVFGYATSTDGIAVAGMQSSYSASDMGGYWKPGGVFGGRNGVCGITKDSGGYGVLGISLHFGGWAGYYYSTGNGVAITSGADKVGLIVYNGTKNAAVEAGGTTRMLYCEESSEVWFTDYGFGRLNAGSAVIEIDPIFAQTVDLGEPYHVFLQPYAQAELYVAERTAESFEVRMGSGDPEAEFSYRIVAKRKGFETQRLEQAPRIAGPVQAQGEE
jgi:hypothetical protein